MKNNNNHNKTTMPPIEVTANLRTLYDKILSKSVDWFKRYSKNQYIGHVDLLLRNWSEGF